MTNPFSARSGGPSHRFVLVIVALCFIPVLRANATSIDSVAFSGAAVNPTVSIYGSGFGSEPIATSYAAYPYTGFDYGTNLHITDRTNVPLFDIGYDDPAHGYHDVLGLVVNSYSDTRISYTFGSNYANAGAPCGDLLLNEGDSFTVYANGVSFNGTVSYTPEPCSLALLLTALTTLFAGCRKARRGHSLPDSRLGNSISLFST